MEKTVKDVCMVSASAALDSTVAAQEMFDG